MKKIVVISSSPRKNGNSETLALELARGAEEAGRRSDLSPRRRSEAEFLHRLHGVPEIKALRPERRRDGRHGNRTRGGYRRIRFPRLLLRGLRSAQDLSRPHESHLHGGASFYRSRADLHRRGRRPRRNGRQYQGHSGLGGLLRRRVL